MIFKRFERAYFDEYKRWFNNDLVKKALSHVDEEWLHYILTDTTGIEYAVFVEGVLIAVVGVLFPTENQAHYCLTNISVNPMSFQLGVGTRVLNKMIELHPIVKDRGWVTFVAVDNLIAQNFFEKNNWKKAMEEDGMIEYRMMSTE